MATPKKRGTQDKVSDVPVLFLPRGGIASCTCWQAQAQSSPSEERDLCTCAQLVHGQRVVCSFSVGLRLRGGTVPCMNKPGACRRWSLTSSLPARSWPWNLGTIQFFWGNDSPIFNVCMTCFIPFKKLWLCLLTVKGIKHQNSLKDNGYTIKML